MADNQEPQETAQQAGKSMHSSRLNCGIEKHPSEPVANDLQEQNDVNTAMTDAPDTKKTEKNRENEASQPSSHQTPPPDDRPRTPENRQIPQLDYWPAPKQPAQGQRELPQTPTRGPRLASWCELQGMLARGSCKTTKSNSSNKRLDEDDVFGPDSPPKDSKT